MIRKLLLMIGLPLLIGGVVAVPIGWVRGPMQWTFAAIAFGLCLVPGLVVLAVSDYLIQTSPFGRILAVFIGTFVRLVVAFGGGVVVFLLAGPDDRVDRIAFWLWVLFAYLTTLTVETALMAGPLRTGGSGSVVAGGSHHAN